MASASISPSMLARKFHDVSKLSGFFVRDTRGQPVRDDTYLVPFNAHHEPVKFSLPGKQEVNWELSLDTRLETGVTEKQETLSAGDELGLTERSMCVLRVVKGSQEDARNISWRRQQKAEAAAPPVPPRPSKHEPIDPTTVGPRFRARTTKTPAISELTQSTPEPDEAPLK